MIDDGYAYMAQEDALGNLHIARKLNSIPSSLMVNRYTASQRNVSIHGTS
jgi:hypothetical protein